MTLRYHWVWRANAAPETLWPRLGDTNPTNRAAGLPALRMESHSLTHGGAHQTGTGYVLATPASNGKSGRMNGPRRITFQSSACTVRGLLLGLCRQQRLNPTAKARRFPGLWRPSPVASADPPVAAWLDARRPTGQPFTKALRGVGDEPPLVRLRFDQSLNVDAA